jgi:membrane protease YdiL (CAAX protease family)
MMVTFLLILGFPLVVGFVFGGWYAVAAATGRRLGRPGILLYPVSLAVPLGAGLISTWNEPSLLGNSLLVPRLPGYGTLLASVIIGAISVTAGVVLFYNEYYVARWALRFTNRSDRVRHALDGATHSIASATRRVPLVSLLAATVPIVFAEEFLWRGYLIGYSTDVLSLQAGLSILLSSVSFGLNHYYLGVRNVLMKTVGGLVWGGLFFITSGLLAPIISHFTFNCLAWRRMRQ